MSILIESRLGLPLHLAVVDVQSDIASSNAADSSCVTPSRRRPVVLREETAAPGSRGIRITRRVFGVHVCGRKLVFTQPDTGQPELAIVGAFDSEGISRYPMTLDPWRGIWTVSIPVRPGRYRYRIANRVQSTLDTYNVYSEADTYGVLHSLVIAEQPTMPRPGTTVSPTGTSQTHKKGTDSPDDCGPRTRS